MNPPDEFDERSVEPVVRRRRQEPAPAPEHDGGAPVPPRRRPEGAGSRPRPEQPGEPARPAAPQAQGQRPPGSRPQGQRPPGQRPPGAPPQGQRPAGQRPQGTRPQGQRPAGQRPPGSRPPAGPGRPRPDRPGDEYVLLPPPSNRSGRKLAAVAGSALLVLAILVGGILVWASRQIDPSGEPGEVVELVEVPRGSSTDAIGTILEEAEVISSARMFRYYVGWKNAGPWEAGQYVDFRRNSSFDEAIEVLDEGPVPPESSVVRVTEGRRLQDALVQISEQMPELTVQELQATLDSGAVTSAYKTPQVTSWEGLLFPDTYEFEEGATAVDVLQTMASQMEEVLDELGYDKAETLQGRTAYELLIIASLIEKETGAPADERGKISRVISNRLDDGETLGIDAAVLYGLGRDSGALTQSDLDTETPYNTRKVVGLPPTPIALPGEASLTAAIQPPEGDWFYYVLVSNDPPTHFFTDDYDEFLDAKARAQDEGVF